MANKRRDLTGQRFGRLTAIKDVGKSKSKHRLWLCHCDCGKETRVRGNDLLSGRRKSCGCLIKNNGSTAEDLTGRKFGRLTVIKQAPRDKKGQVFWQCQCDCGNTTVVHAGHLKNGHTQSCGCLSKEKLGTGNLIENIDGSKLSSWTSKKVGSKSSTGIRGISKLASGRYRAYMQFKGKRVLFEEFDTLEEAIAARKNAWNKYVKPYLEEHIPRVEKMRKDRKENSFYRINDEDRIIGIKKRNADAR